MKNYMLLAIEQAKLAKVAGDRPFGAIVLCNDRVVGEGKDESETSGDVTSHAELQAIRAACQTLGKNNLEDCVIYTTNEPCLMCAAGIFQAKIPKVYIGASREDLPKLLRSRNLRIYDLADDSGYKITIKKGVLKDKVLELFEGVVKK